MTTLAARFVAKSRRAWSVCDSCGLTISGGHVYLYGMADSTDRPSGMRLHVRCVGTPANEPKIAAALAAASQAERGEA